ncbi:hypothetical protein [Sphingomonas ginkgonis]|uniref:hypothetical protein n=1 Tax=Sphingomonas ginkgonis TaxID=2315330 RepID=UPI00163B3B8F|nr:hypothetical protein [Sphingomonas ginkgonis]
MQHAWIIETDIYRLNKRHRLAKTADEKRMLAAQIDDKRALLAEIRAVEQQLREMVALA